MMFYPLDSLANAGRKGQYELGPNILAWIKRMQERPAMQRAQARQAEEEEKQRPGKESASL
jgi:glutathione S-transferase